MRLLEVNVPKDVEKVHVLMSGGVDSTLLLYLLLEEKILDDRSYHIQCHTLVHQGRIDYIVVKPILSWLHNRFGIKLYTRGFRKNDLGTYYMREIASKLIENEGGVVYSGCNLNPPEAKSWETIDNKIPYRGEETHPNHYRPFINLTKDVILREYVTRNILDLFRLTWSCNGPLTRIESKTPCNRCFFCLELNWAKEKFWTN